MTLVTKVWNYSGSSKTFQIPANVLSVRWEAWGAAGGACFNYGLTTGVTDLAAASSTPNGFYFSNPGGYAAGTLAVVAGDAYYIYVGGNGYAGQRYSLGGGSGSLKGGNGGWNGGGAGGRGHQPVSGSFQNAPAGGGGGGGGETDIRFGGTANANRILVGGGAGGVGGGFPTGKGTGNLDVASNPTTPDPPYGIVIRGTSHGTPDKVSKYISGGYGKGGWGGPTGANGGWGVGSGGGANAGNAGQGATQAANGTKGVHTGSFGTDGANGAFAVGGAGGGVTNSDAVSGGSTCGGGGGGAGYRSGGGGSTGYGVSLSTPGTAGGGGGGANLVDGSFTATSSKAHAYPPFAAGATGSGGFVRATYTQPPDAPEINLPLNFSSVDVSQPLDVVFEFSSPDSSAVLVGYDIQWRLGAGAWTLTHVGPLQPAESYIYTFPAAFFTAGNNYDIAVRTYDQNNDVSAFQQITIAALTLPVAPTITLPTAGQELPTTAVTVNWTNGAGSPELALGLTFLDKDGGLVFDTGVLNTNTRVNLSPNPSFEVDTTSWVCTGGTLAVSTTFHAIGLNSGRVTWNTVTNGTAVVYVPIATIPGLPYTFSAEITSNGPTQPLIMIGAQNPTDLFPFATGDQTVAYSSGVFQRINVSFYAEAAITWLVLTPADGNTTTGALTYIDKVQAEIDGIGAPRLYFDGSNLNGNSGTLTWAGTTGKSASRLVNTDILTYAYTWPRLSAENISVFVKVATVASNGVFSDSAERIFTVNINPPAASTVTLTTDDANGHVQLHMVAGAFNGTTSFATTYWDVYRTDPRTGVETRIATGLLPSAPALGVADYYDRSAGTEVAYTYRVKAFSATSGFKNIT